MRLTRVVVSREQHLTIPAHKPLRAGTLREILKDVAEQTRQSLESVLEALE